MTRIPLPSAPGEGLLKGIDTGSSMFSRLMQPILEREKQKQLEAHFQEQLKLSKAAAARAAANSGLNRQILQEKLKNLQDPTREIRALYELANKYQSQGHENNSQNNQSFNPELLHQQLQSMGMFPQQQYPEGQGAISLQEQQQIPEYPVSENFGSDNQQTQGGMPNLMQMIVGGALKKKTGVNPFATTKENALTGPAREASDLERLKKSAGENSEVYKNAEAAYRSKVQHNEDLSAIRARQLNGLKPGDVEIKDPNTGQTIGFRKQTTDKQKEAAKNTVLFNQLYPLVQGSANLSGPGATARFEYAARTYKTNPQSKKIIDDLLIADKAASTTAVTEASRFNAGHTNQTFNRLVDTLKSEDIHKKLKKWIKEYEIPSEANIKADKRWQIELNKAEKLANSRIPATMDYYFDPEKQFAAQQEQQSNNNETSTTQQQTKVIDGITYYADGQGGWEHD